MCARLQSAGGNLRELTSELLGSRCNTAEARTFTTCRSSRILEQRRDLQSIDGGGIPDPVDEVEGSDHLPEDFGRGRVVRPGSTAVDGVQGEDGCDESACLGGAARPVLRLGEHLCRHEGGAVLALVLQRERLAVRTHVHARTCQGRAVKLDDAYR